MRMHTSHKLKMQENIASMSLTILVGDFQPQPHSYVQGWCRILPCKAKRQELLTWKLMPFSFAEQYSGLVHARGKEV